MGQWVSRSVGQVGQWVSGSSGSSGSVGQFRHTTTTCPKDIWGKNEVYPQVSLGRVTEAEEAALAFAACGVTGYALADLAYGKGQGGQMLAGLLGHTVASPDAINIGISPRGFCRQRT